MAKTVALERLVKLIALLPDPGSVGKPALELAEELELTGSDKSKRDVLARDIRNLRKQGVEINNISPEGEEARYILVPGDSRVRLAFPESERAELARAALLAANPDVLRELGTPDDQAEVGVELHLPQASDLDLVLRALGARCRLRFSYNGKDRDVTAISLHLWRGGWTITGIDTATQSERTFALRRMTKVSIDEPGTVATARHPQRNSTDPLTWQLDAAITAELETPKEFAADVVDLLHGETSPATESDWVVVRAEVTNRRAFFFRLIELGTRVKLIGPEDLRQQFRSEFLEPFLASGSNT